MLFGTDQQSFNWDMQQPNTQTPFASFQSQQPQQPPQQRLYQKNDASRMPNTRRYSSSGTSTPAQQIGYPMPGQQQLQSQQLIQNCRRVNPKGTYRSATFHQPTNTFPTTRLPQPAQQRPNGQLRTSSSFHGSLQSHGNQPYSGRSSNNGVHAAGQPTQKTSIYTAVNGQFCPGMKDVPIWLKSLRLHKYTRMFQEMTYEEMMALTDQKLEQRQVTKGARKKILNSIEKLQDRSQLIRQLEKCIDERGDVRCLIVELRAMMHTPIAAYKPDEEPKPSNYSIDAIGMLPHEVSDDNLAGLIARLCIRLHEFLFRNGLPQIQELGIEDDYLIKLLQVYEKILYNEAFTYRQRYCINECKRVLSRFMHEQKILIGNSSPVNGQNSSPMAPRQPTLVSSPSSGYQTISPPNSSTRRNSDTNSDTNSAPASPPAVHLLNQYQQQYSGQQTSNQTCPPPGFEWSASNNTNVNMPAKAPSHFQPYVDSDVLSSGWYNHNQQTEDAMSTQNSRMWGQQPANKDDRSTLLALLDSNPILYNILLQQVQQQSQLQQPVQTKPPKPLSPIGTRPANYQQQQPTKTEASDIRLLEMVTNQLRQITNEDQGLETLNMALHYSMEHLKLNRQKET
ncbi:Protein Smaug [Aphelenchoides bicaudatus]|nr:Protein Smaug [Aphelenchoides bicaudatus]